MSSRSKRGYAGRRNRKLRPELIPGPAQYISPGLPDFPNGLLDRAMELVDSGFLGQEHRGAGCSHGIVIIVTADVVVI
jgi:hypothetical protein